MFDLRQNEIVVPVTVSGHGPFRFLLDTGASQSVVSARVAESVGARATARTLMMTPAGHVVRPAVRIVLGLGDRPPLTVTATVLASSELTSSGATIDGIIGQDVLSSLVYIIDYRRRMIRWDGCDGLPTGAALPLSFTEGRALVSLTALPGSSEPLRLIPDTGADDLVLFARRGRLSPVTSTGEVAMLRTLAGHQLVRRAVLDVLRIGEITLRNHPALVLIERDRELPSGDGLLPLHLFSRVLVNGAAGYMVVER